MSRSELHVLCKKNDIQGIMSLWVTNRDTVWEYALEFACFYGSSEIVQFLIDECHVTWFDSGLRAATKSSNLGLMQKMIDCGADDFESCLVLAASSGSMECFEFLYTHLDHTIANDSVLGTALNRAASKGQLAMVQYILNNYPTVVVVESMMIHVDSPQILALLASRATPVICTEHLRRIISVLNDSRPNNIIPVAPYCELVLQLVDNGASMLELTPEIMHLTHDHIMWLLKRGKQRDQFFAYSDMALQCQRELDAHVSLLRTISHALPEDVIRLIVLF